MYSGSSQAQPLAPYTVAPEPVAVDIRAGIVVGLALIALGAPLGLLWAALTPHLAVIHISPKYFQVSRNFVESNAEESHAAFGGDAVMLAIMAGAGLLTGLAVIRAARKAPMGIVVGVLVGGVLCGAVCMAVGHIAVEPSYHRVLAGPGNAETIYQLKPYVRGRVDMVVLPIFALLALLAGWLVSLLRSSP